MTQSFFAKFITCTVLGLLQAASADAQAPVKVPTERMVAIRDPVFNNMDAFHVWVPVKWSFRGTMVQGDSCNTVPFPVFRTTSPDGLSAMELMPRLDWLFGNDPIVAQNHNDCLPLKTAMSARDFLKYIAGTLNVEYVGEEPVPADIVAEEKKKTAAVQANWAQRYIAAGMRPPVNTVDLGRAIVRFRKGTVAIKGMLSTNVNCTSTMVPGPGGQQRGHTMCWAVVRYVTAPEEQFQTVNAMVDPSKVDSVQLDPWTKAWMDMNNQQTAANIRQIQAQGAANIARIKANGEQFRQSQAVRQHMHEEFLSTMRRGTDMSMNRTKSNMDARSRSTSDWVDYALDQQTVRDPQTGQSNKVSSGYTYTWSNGTRTYQTNDPNYNPNGVLPGNWTRQQKVHGDGSQ